MYRKTPVAAREVPAPYSRLMSLLRLNKIPAPIKDSSGDFLWSDEDIARAREAIRELDQRRQRKAVVV